MKELIQDLPANHSLVVQYFGEIIYFEIKKGTEIKYSGFEKEELEVERRVQEKFMEYKNEGR